MTQPWERTTFSRVSAPVAPVLTLQEAWDQLRLDPTFGSSPRTRPDDDLIAALVEAATQEVDGPDGWLGRFLVTQTWRMNLPAFPCGGVQAIPFPPLQSVASITYTDGDGVEQVMGSSSPQQFRVITGNGDYGYIAPLYGEAWPGSIRSGAGYPVAIEFTAGYGDLGTDVPELIRTYIRARLGFYYQFREAYIAGTQIMPVHGYSYVLENLRVRGQL